MKRALLSVVVILSLSASAVAKTELPLKDVTLFTSGVGYFERSTEVSGNEEAELSFKTEQIADIIKSMVLLDEGGGRIAAVSYESRDPVERTLKSFSVDLSDNPTLADLLNRLRGVEVRVKATASDLKGEIVGVEGRQKQIEDPDAVIEEFTLKLNCVGGIRAIPLDTIQELQVLDTKIQADFAAALKVLAGSHDQSKKGVKLSFIGEKKRNVRVGYMLETPVWKTSYRLVLEGKDPFVQGWAHVENMTDDDWTDVRLSLVSGKPISFIQNLYDPIYLRRPEVKMELDAVAPPPMYDSVMAMEPEAEMSAGTDAEGDYGAGGGVAMKKGLYAARSMVAAAPSPRRMAMPAMQNTPAAAEAEIAGELFEYAIKEPVTLPRRQSAMLPIVNMNIKGEKLSIYNESVNAKYPLNGIELENNTGLYLMQGPVTVFEDGVYAGDARLPDTQRGEKRLMSYAVDLAEEVVIERRSQPEEVVSLKIVHGSLAIGRKFVSEADYKIKNKRDKERLVLVEHPLQQDWELVEPKKDFEKTRDNYRFRVKTEAGKTATLNVKEQKTDSYSIYLSNMQFNQVDYYISLKAITPAVSKALKQLKDMQTELAGVRVKREKQERRVMEITAEQARIRSNMQTVAKNSESYSMWERKLVAQEKELDTINSDLEGLRGQEMEKQEAVNNYIANLNVE